jgi:hypothetical protein
MPAKHSQKIEDAASCHSSNIELLSKQHEQLKRTELTTNGRCVHFTSSSRTSGAAVDEPAATERQSQTSEEELKVCLGDTLVPLLAYALDESEKIRPPDPVLFLAHFRLRHNPKKSYQ